MVISFDSRYKFTGKERDEETAYDYFGARYYDSDLCQWLSVDPMSDKYPSLSPYMYCAGNPVVLVDTDGMEIEGFSVDKKGNVQIDKEKASQHAIIAYEAMSMTETGNQAFKDMITMETQISFEITDEALYDGGVQIHGKTIGDANDLTKSGEYKSAKITISTAEVSSNTNDRYNGFCANEKINGIGTHESVHLKSKQIRKDFSNKSERAVEQAPVMLEYQSRKEYRQKYGKEGERNIKPNYENYLYKRNINKVD